MSLVWQFFCLLVMLAFSQLANAQRVKYNFNLDWKLVVGEPTVSSSRTTPPLVELSQQKGKVQAVTLPHALNEGEAFRVRQNELTDTVAWYYKTFNLDATGKKVFVEFEGVRQCADVYVNHKYVGYHDNGVMAFGFDLTPYIKKGKNEIAVRVDNRATYVERSTGVKHQWNDVSFSANYGGISKNVNLYVTDKVYQTLPLYSNLGTTGTYIYASNFDIKGRKATVNVESEVKNESGKAQTVGLQVDVIDMNGKRLARFNGRSKWWHQVLRWR